MKNQNKTKTPLSYDELLELTTLQRNKIMRIRIVSCLLLINIAVWSIAYVKAKSFYNDYYDLLIQVANKKTQTAMAAEPTIIKEPTIEEYIKQEVEKAGLNWLEVRCLLDGENKQLDPWAQGVNNNKTTDSGIWQINSTHKETISLKDRFDYKKATKWAINKRLHDGNWNAWYGYINNNCGRFK